MEKKKTQSLDYDNFHYQFVKLKAKSVDFLNISIANPILWLGLGLMKNKSKNETKTLNPNKAKYL